MRHLSLAFTTLVVASLLFTSCGKNVHHASKEIDSLNQQAYLLRYSSLDKTMLLAKQAEQKARQNSMEYSDGYYEALLHQAFVRAMQMDYEPAQQLCQQVLSSSKNELLKLVADVQMMRICQRQSANKELYDYHNSAIQRMERISSEVSRMNPHQHLLWNYARSDFYFTLSIYYYYLRQEQQSFEMLDEVARNPLLLENDTTQLAMYMFLAGNSRNVDNRFSDDDVNLLMRAVWLGHKCGIGYVESKALTSLAVDMMQGGSDWRPSRMAYLRELYSLDSLANDTLMGVELCQRALNTFQQYGSKFDVSQTYIALAQIYMRQNNPQRALDMLRLADMPEARKVPEWLADIHEAFCMVYSAMGEKRLSDQHGNAYLDILEANRQDRRMEQRLSVLQTEEKSMNRQMLLAGVAVLLLILLVVYLTRRIRNNYRSNYQRELKAVEQEMEQWRAQTDKDYSSLEERQENVESERYVNERHLQEQKRQYVDKMTCLSLVYAVTPFLDRAVNEVKKMSERTGMARQQSVQYLSELIERINLYNDILTHWVKVRQGTVSLNIENFELQSLFDILGKNTNVFKNKQLEFIIHPTTAVVKADRALTLFMMTTVLENARKYTPRRGKISLNATSNEKYVEISVNDTGRGLSSEDVATILGEKLYDASSIGDVQHDEDLKRNKGFGFGLMNCKGIIEKYRKTNQLFSVCLFGIESTLGKGSRFFFRLPHGVTKKVLAWLLFLLPSFFTFLSCTPSAPSIDDVHQKAASLPNDTLIEQASNYADQAYFANIEGKYNDALQYVDSACHRLNDYYLQKRPNGTLLLHLVDKNQMNEIHLWNRNFRTDYHIILDIRNEAAIAALALKQFDIYYYNNEIYTRLYKLMAQDTTLEKYCNDIKAANTNKQTILLLATVLFVFGLIVYFMVYYHNHILTTFNLRQILEVNRRIFNLEQSEQMATIIDDGINDVRRTDAVCLLFQDGTTQFSRPVPQQDFLCDQMRRSMQQGRRIVQQNGKVRIYPLQVTGESAQIIGAIAIVLHNVSMQKGDDDLFQRIAHYVATNIYYSLVRMERLNNEIELLDDERRRVEMEANHVHVQNMILDNCLSTIKHETMYYPSRIQQIIQSSSSMDAEQIHTIDELISYYKDVYTLLSGQAARQLDNVLFRRKVFPVDDIQQYAEKAFLRLYKKVRKECDIIFTTTNDTHNVLLIADVTMLEYLVENVFSAFVEEKISGTLCLNFAKSEEFVKFAFSFDGITRSEEELHSLFYPDNLRYDAATDTLHGAQFLVARQIIREHDEHVRRGCRIYAQPLHPDGTGVCLSFTIPVKI